MTTRIEPLPPQVHADRRRHLQQEIGEGVAVIPGARLSRRSHDVDYVFRQSSDLLYLTGFPEPDCVAILTQDRYVLFVPPRDPDAETWTGIRAGVEGARENYRADEAYPIGELDERMPALLEDRPRLYYALGVDKIYDDLVLRSLEAVRVRVRKGVVAPREIIDPRATVHEMRMHKSAEELEIMRAAAAISAEAHGEAARLCHAGTPEYEIEAALQWVFRRRGGSGPAYPSIVGTGDNATILHYIENQGVLREGELVLIDAGVELHGYASDVTRTYPVGGRFEGVAREVYEAALAAQTAALEEVHTGATLVAIHDRAVRSIVESLIELGALEGGVDELIESEAYRPFYMHTTSHWLGLDVHDVGDYRLEGKPRSLEPGMVFTIEPGLYFPARDVRTPERLRGIGVRIEDDVAITENGFEVLTRDIPKRPADVEAAVSG
jgi:Xaa-Pro aminopeptidase